MTDTTSVMADAAQNEELVIEVWRIQPAKASVAGQVGALWRYRHLFGLFFFRSLFSIYRNSFLGLGWLAIHALVLAIASSFVVGDVFGVSVAPFPLPLFILAGIANWVLFRRSLQWMTKSMNSSRSLLRRTYVPALLLLVTTFSPGVFEFLIVSLVAGALAFYYGPIQGVFYLSFGWHILAVAPAMILTVLLAVAVSCFTAILNAFARDTWLTMRYVISGWMLATPILYPLSVIPENYRWIAYLNPLAPIVELFRWAVLGYGGPNWPYVGLATIEIGVLLLLGLWFFAKQHIRLFDHM